MNDAPPPSSPPPGSLVERVVRFFMANRLIVLLLVVVAVVWGYMTAPFDWSDRHVPRDPVAVDAIPDIGENQQIVFTEWAGRSPQDVEDQITYPMTASLMGIRGVKTIRSVSMFGFSSIYVIFDEDVEFELSRQRILEKLASLPANSLPADVRPQLGPDSTALGQVFWYTLEGRDAEGNPAGGWDLDELRSIQDWHVRYALLGAGGVSEVASIGGYVREYQIDVDPDAMRAAGVTLTEVFNAVRESNRDVGARTIEINNVEYVVRGLGLIESVEDLERTVVAERAGVPITVGSVAHVSLGPALRRGALDKAGAEAVGGVVVVRYGENPLSTIQNVKAKIAEIAPGLPRRTLDDGRVSQVTIVPFYDRTGLIYETLETLNQALSQQILVTIVVVLLMLMHVRSSVLVSGLLPLAVLMTFIAMKTFGVDANIVALSGIAIAIGTMVDMGIIISENILKSLEEAGPDERRFDVVCRAASEVGGAVLTSSATTIVSFLPVFTMTAAEGKLFRPLAFTKTFALVAALIVALFVIPSAAYVLFTLRRPGRTRSFFIGTFLSLAGLILALIAPAAFLAHSIGVTGQDAALVRWCGGALLAVGAWFFVAPRLDEHVRRRTSFVLNVLIVGGVVLLLADYWAPLGAERGRLKNSLFVFGVIGGFLAAFFAYTKAYPTVLRFCLRRKRLFLTVPVATFALGMLAWLGFTAFFGWLPRAVTSNPVVSTVAHTFPGLDKEFMPSLDEGSFLWMPTTMPHASIGEVMDIMRKQDMAIQAIPEVEQVVGKLGRAETPLDPAPVSMIETIINYHAEFRHDALGRATRYRFDPDATDLFRDFEGNPVPAPDGAPYTVQGVYARDDAGRPIPDHGGRPFLQWRPALDPELNPGRQAWPGIQSSDAVWDRIVAVAQVPGSTSAPKLQPIETRIVMLQSGMRAAMGVKVRGPDLASIESVGLEIEGLLKQVPGVDPATVAADRIVGKPYLEVDYDRESLARYGLTIEDVQRVLEVAVGGAPLTTTIEGRERYPVRVRYLRELRDTIESLDRILVPAPDGAQIPMASLAEVRYKRGPQMIRNENTFLTAYVTFGMRPGRAEVEVVDQARTFLESRIAAGEFELPAGVSYAFAGSFENQVRAARRLRVVLPLALLVIFIILYLDFRSALVALTVFSGVAVAWSGGFLLLWLYGQPWFMDFAVFGANLRDLFQIAPVNLSVAVWVGFIALFGIATDDGVVMATYIQQSLRAHAPTNRAEARNAIMEAGRRRIRPCMMTTATTILALLPVLTSTGRGSDILIPMAIPAFGGMLIQIMTTLVVPVLCCSAAERRAEG